MKVFRTAFILSVGIVAGVLMTRFLPSDAVPTTAIPVATLPESDPAPDSRLSGPTVTLKGQSTGNLQSRTLAVVVGEANVVIAAIDDFVGAKSLVVETDSREVVRVIAVLAADERYGIAALRTAKPINGVEVLQPETQSGSLYLGRDVSLLTRTNRYDAQVNSAASQDELGSYRYELTTSRQSQGETAAIIDPRSRQLLGLATGIGNSAYSVSAIDSDAIKQLLASIGVQPQRTLVDYANHYFSQTTAGRLALLKHLVTSEQLDNAISFGNSILNLDAYTQQYSTPLLHRAYAGVARAQTEASQWQRVIALLGQAEQTVGLTEELRLLRAESYQAVGELELALEDLLALDNPDTYRVRMKIIENALAAGHGGNQSGLSLLERALASDPDFAPYHRMLGETLARQGDLAGALAALETALALDPTMAVELDPLLQRLRARRDTPVLTEVPIQRQRSTMYVDAHVNGSSNTFRFLFDTGASFTAITTETALRLGINNIFFGAPVVQLETANGRVYTTTATLSSIDVGGARVNQVEAVILESMSGVDGLLGQSFLRHFDIDINRSRGVIVFNRRIDE